MIPDYLLLREQGPISSKSQIWQTVSWNSKAKFDSTAGSNSGWEPVGSPETKIVLLGDSNSGGKIKFGQGKGTLVAALPGSDTFKATVEDLPEPETFNDISDLILAVGTNNKLDSCIPEYLAKSTFTYIKKVRKTHRIIV